MIENKREWLKGWAQILSATESTEFAEKTKEKLRVLSGLPWHRPPGQVSRTRAGVRRTAFGAVQVSNLDAGEQIHFMGDCVAAYVQRRLLAMT